MYANRYEITMKIPGRMDEPFTSSERCRLENSRLEHNRRFTAMPRRHTQNRKHLSQISVSPTGVLRFTLETEFPLPCPDRLGNALRFFSLVALDNGLDLFVRNHRLLRRS